MEEHFLNQNICEVLEDNKCCGCGACVNICKTGALEYTNDNYGFIIPKFNAEQCLQCGQCLKVCPSKHKQASKPIEAFAAMAKDVSERLHASSGGIFGTISKEFIDNGGIVYGAKMDQDFRVHHDAAIEGNTLTCILRSKYIQSDMRNTYKQVVDLLQGGKKVLFSGTPCQVSAMRNFVPDKYKERLFLVDVVCHGVPSQLFFDSYLSYLEEKEGEIESYRFRAKRQVNNGMNWFFSYKVKGHREVLKNWPEDIFNYLYMKSYIYRDSCYTCNYATEDRCSDLTLCDYWGWHNYQRKFKVGSTVSGILVNTEKGRQLLNDINEKLIIERAELDNIKRHNGCLVSPSDHSGKREQILDEWKNNGFANIENVYNKTNRRNILKSRIMRIVPAAIMNMVIWIKLKLTS